MTDIVPAPAATAKPPKARKRRRRRKRVVVVTRHVVVRRVSSSDAAVLLGLGLLGGVFLGSLMAGVPTANAYGSAPPEVRPRPASLLDYLIAFLSEIRDAARKANTKPAADPAPVAP